MRILIGRKVIAISSSYAPQSGLPEPEKDKFYFNLLGYISSVPAEETGSDLKFIRDVKVIGSEEYVSQHKLLVCDLELNTSLCKPKAMPPVAITHLVNCVVANGKIPNDWSLLTATKETEGR